MPSPNNRLPIYGPGRVLLQYATPATAQRLIDTGLVIPAGTKHRTRALIAVRDNIYLLPSARPPANQRYSYKDRTEEIPGGVWTHNYRKIRLHL